MTVLIVVSLLISISAVLAYEKRAAKRAELDIKTLDKRLIEVSLRDEGRLFPCVLRYRLSIENRLTGDIGTGTICLGSGFVMKGMNAAKITINSPYPGNYRIRVENRLRKFSGALLIMPETYPVEVKGGLSSLLDLDGSVYSPVKSGFDMSEVFSIREYKSGDSLKGVHWKLSNKLDSLLVREGSFPIKNSVLILMETGFGLEGEELKQKAKDTVTAALSLSEALLDEGIGHHIAWWDGENNTMAVWEISGISELKNCLGELLASRTTSSREAGLRRYYEDTREKMFSRVAYVDGKIEDFERLFNRI